MTGVDVLAAALHPLQPPLWIDLASVVVGAQAGAGVAVRQRLDAVGAFVLAVAMGLGGGIIRDLLLGLRPVAVTSPYYLPTVAVAALTGLLIASLLQRFATVFTVLDAMSVGLFTIVGVEKTLLYGLPYASAIFIGVCSAVGGGALVDVIAGRPVGVVHYGPWYATASVTGACVYAAAAALGAPSGIREALAFAVVVVMRLAAVRWGLETPLPADLSKNVTTSVARKIGTGRRRRADHDGSRDTTTERHQ